MTYLVLVALAVLALYGAALTAPRLAREDGAYESATALAFAAAALVAGAVCLRAWRVLDVQERCLYCLAGSVSLLAFLSEISFGARMFGWSMPKMSGGGELDGAHDFFILLVRWVRGASAPAVALAAALSAAVAATIAYVLRAPIARLARRVVEDAVLFRLAVSVALLCGAVGLDAYSIRQAELLEESLETVSSLGVLYAMVLALFSKTR